MKGLRKIKRKDWRNKTPVGLSNIFHQIICIPVLPFVPYIFSQIEY